MDERRDMRASDADRERVAERLRRAGAEGRLDTEELEQRLEVALRARTTGELDDVVRDLPSTRRRRSGSSRHRRRGVLRHRFLVVSILLIATWALTGAGYFWPAWAIGGLAWWAFSPGCGSRRARVGSRRDAVQALRS